MTLTSRTYQDSSSPVHDEIHLLSQAFEEVVQLFSLPPTEVVVPFAETKVDLQQLEYRQIAIAIIVVIVVAIIIITIIAHDHHALGGPNLHRHHHDIYPGVAVHEAPHVVERST